MKLYQKLRDIIRTSDMSIVDKAYLYGALLDIATYAKSDDYACFVNGGMSGFNGIGLNDKQGALDFLSAVGGLAEHECSECTSSKHLNGIFVSENAGVLCECFKKHGLITDGIVNAAVHSLCTNYNGHIRMLAADARFQDIELSADIAKMFVKQEIIARFNRKPRTSISDIEQTKLLDISVEYFLKMFDDETRTVAFISSLFVSMSDEQLRTVYSELDCL